MGAIVNQLRLQRGWSLAQLAKVTGMNPIYLGVLERGENVPTLTTILRVADGLGVAPAELVHRVDVARHAARARRAAPIAVTYEVPGSGGPNTE